MNLGLYPSLEDSWHYLKTTGGDLEELRARGLFEAGWAGCVLAPWKDLQGRTVNIWGWQPWEKPPGKAPFQGFFLFDEDDPLGGRKLPFYMDVAARLDRYDLILLEGPITALLAYSLGLQNPFPVAAGGTLTQAQAESLKNYLRSDGSLTLCGDYDPESYGTVRDRTVRMRNLLKKFDLPVYVVDPSLLAGNGKAKTKVSVDEFILARGGGERGLRAFQRLLEERQAEAAVQEGPFPGKTWPDLLGMFRGPSKQARGDVLERLFSAAEEIGIRIAKGFLKGLPQGLRKGLLPDQTLRLEGLTEESPPLARLPSPPPSFSVERLEQEGRRRPMGKVSGWKALDGLEVRFNPAELAVIAGRPGHGKTSILAGLLVEWLDSASQVGSDELYLVYSMDESEVAIYHRLVSLLTARARRGWTLHQVQDYLRDPDAAQGGRRWPDQGVLHLARERLRGWESNLHIVHRPTWTMTQMESHARSLAAGRTIGALFVDHLQRISPPVPKLGRRGQQALAVARCWKALAVELSCPVVATAQIGRQAVRWARRIPLGRPFEDTDVQEAIKMRRPQLQQLKESGSGEEADLVLGLLNYIVDYRSELGQEVRPPGPTRLDVGSLKNRSGPVGFWATLVFEGRFGLLHDPPLEPEEPAHLRGRDGSGGTC